MSVALTAYAIAQGYQLDVLATNLPQIGGQYFNAGQVKLSGDGFILISQINTGAIKLNKFTSLSYNQDFSTSTPLSVQTALAPNPYYPVCCNGVLYVHGDGTLIGVPNDHWFIWNSTDETTFPVLATDAVIGTDMVADVGRNCLYFASSRVSPNVAAIKKYDIDTATVSIVHQDATTNSGYMSLALRSDENTLYFIRVNNTSSPTDAAVYTIDLSTSVVTRQYALNIFSGFSEFGTRIASLEGTKSGQVVVVGATTVSPTESANLIEYTDGSTFNDLTTGIQHYSNPNMSLNILDGNRLTFAYLESLYVLTAPTGSGFSRGGCYDFGTGGDAPVVTACQDCCDTPPEVTLTWTAVDGAIGYDITRGMTQIATVGNVLTYTDYPPTALTDYIYGVSAILSGGDGQRGFVSIRVHGFVSDADDTDCVFTTDAPVTCTFTTDPPTSCTFTSDACTCH